MVIIDPALLCFLNRGLSQTFCGFTRASRQHQLLLCLPKFAEALNEMTSLQGKPRLVKGTPPDLQTPGGGKAESGQRDADWDSY